MHLYFHNLFIFRICISAINVQKYFKTLNICFDIQLDTAASQIFQFLVPLTVAAKYSKVFLVIEIMYIVITSWGIKRQTVSWVQALVICVLFVQSVVPLCMVWLISVHIIGDTASLELLFLVLFKDVKQYLMSTHLIEVTCPDHIDWMPRI